MLGQSVLGQSVLGQSLGIGSAGQSTITANLP
jgi:hypothetical protein